MRILVAYGTKRGGNEGLARAVATGLVAAGHAVDVIAAAKVDALDRWDAVVVGGAPYAWFWQRDARRFVKRNVEDLFEAKPSALMMQLLTAVQPAPQLSMWPVQGPPPAPEPEPEPEPEFDEILPATLVQEDTGGSVLVHRAVLWSCLFTGVTALAGGVSLLFGEGGFDRYLVPSLILMLVVGGGNLAASLLEARRVEHSELVASVAGASLMGWLLVDLVMMRSFSWVAWLYLGLALCTVAGAAWLWRVRNQLLPVPVPS